ncbi:MAG TPA: glycosyltransferase family 2 protein [Puia sp.]|jgi:glycosyltransferase involved in cell wall biosynthesis
MRKISIITTTYNSAKTIRDTLTCIKQQNYPLIEHIIVDGNSIDNTLKIVAEFSHISKIVSEKDNGIYEAMNKGISLATGDVIGILNSDDIYSNDSIITTIANEFEDENTDAVYADLQYVKHNNFNRIVRTWKTGKLNRKSFYYGWMPPHPTFFVRKKIYDKVGLFNTSLRSAADYEMMLRILLKYEVPSKYIPQVIVKMRSGGISNSSIRNRIKANREDRLAWKLNGLKPYFFTLYAKPIRKIVQYLKK